MLEPDSTGLVICYLISLNASKYNLVFKFELSCGIYGTNFTLKMQICQGCCTLTEKKFDVTFTALKLSL